MVYFSSALLIILNMLSSILIYCLPYFILLSFNFMTSSFMTLKNSCFVIFYCLFVIVSTFINSLPTSLFFHFQFLIMFLLHFNFIRFNLMHTCHKASFSFSISYSLLCSLIFLIQFIQTSLNLCLLMSHHF